MKRKAVLLTTRADTSEMEELVFALGADLVATHHQRRAAPDPQLFLGSGRMEEVRGLVRDAGVDLVVVNAALKPGQIFGIQRFLGATHDDRAIEVYDRTRLILEIFRDRARSPEARLQVELAQLQYDMPLVKEAISAQKRGERQAAMFGGGEYAADVEYDRMKHRMARIRRDLEKMRLERGVRRKHRRRSGFHLVSLAGYTNAGKSSLLKALSKERTLVENRYFSTLSTKTARASSDRREILVTDTVGFIEDLPPWMVEAFHSTLEEIALADVILLVVDASDPIPEMVRRLRSSLRVLWEYDAAPERGHAATAPPPDAPRGAGVSMRHATRASMGIVREAEERGDGRAGPAVGSDAGDRDAAVRGSATDDIADPRGRDVALIGNTRSGADVPPDAGAEPGVGPGARAADASGLGSGGGLGTRAGLGSEAGLGKSYEQETRAGPGTGPGAGTGTPAARMPWRRGLAPILVALNKTDRLTADEIDARVDALVAEGLIGPDGWVAVSARTGAGLEAFYDKLYALIPDYDEYEVALPPSPASEAFLAWLHDAADVLDLTRGNEAHVHFEAKRSLRPELLSRLAACGAEPLREARRGEGSEGGESAGAGATAERGAAPQGARAEDASQRAQDPSQQAQDASQRAQDASQRTEDASQPAQRGAVSEDADA